jgi:hypothetical protein
MTPALIASRSIDRPAPEMVDILDATSGVLALTGIVQLPADLGHLSQVYFMVNKSEVRSIRPIPARIHQGTPGGRLRSCQRAPMTPQAQCGRIDSLNGRIKDKGVWTRCAITSTIKEHC